MQGQTQVTLLRGWLAHFCAVRVLHVGSIPTPCRCPCVTDLCNVDAVTRKSFTLYGTVQNHTKQNLSTDGIQILVNELWRVFVYTRVWIHGLPLDAYAGVSHERRSECVIAPCLLEIIC